MLSLLLLAAVTSPMAEPPGLARAARGLDPARATNALADAAFDACRAEPFAPGIGALPCRLALVGALVRSPPTSAAELTQRQAMLADLADAAAWAAEHTPEHPQQGLRRTRLDAQRRACSLIFEGAAVLDTTTTTLKADAHAAATSARTRACACAERTVTLAISADAPPDEQAQVQGVITSQRCFLNGDAPTTSTPRGPGGFARGSAVAQVAAAAASPAGRLTSFAESRTVELQRCTDKGIVDGAIADGAKLDRCACGVVSRWKLPLGKDDGRVAADLPLAEGVVLPVVVEAGKVTTCGPARRR
jgi:hypothetical protein